MNEPSDEAASPRAAEGAKEGAAAGAPDTPHEVTAEEKLELLARMMDLIPDFFYVHDHEMRFRYANQRAADYFGRPKEELIGKRLVDVDPNPAQAQTFVDVCVDIMRRGEPRLTDNLAYTRPDGSPGVLRQHDIPFTDPLTGKPMLMGLSRDVTVERELERERLARVALEKELEIAREIQRALQPVWQPRGLEGLEIAGVSQPAQYAGGDFYDWFPTQDGRIVLLMGDVTGHGVGPALLAAACRAYARVLLASGELVASVRRLGELLGPDLGDGRFVTVAAAMLEPGRANWNAQIVSAGQGPILVRRYSRSGSRVEDIATHAPPLGVAPLDQSVAPARIELDPGDALVMTSDGVIEARNAEGLLFGSTRLRSLLSSSRAAGGTALGGEIEAAVAEFVGEGAAQDDITIVVAGASGAQV